MWRFLMLPLVMGFAFLGSAAETLLAVQNERLQSCCERTGDIRHLVVLLDLSGSMNGKEYAQTRGKTAPAEAVDLLTPVRSILSYVVKSQLRPGDTFTVIPFGDTPNAPVPFEIKRESDKQPIVDMLHRLMAQYDYTDLGLALERALEYLTRGQQADQEIVLLLISDGLHEPSPNIVNRYGPVSGSQFQQLLTRFRQTGGVQKWNLEIVGIDRVTDLQNIATSLGANFTAIQSGNKDLEASIGRRLDRYFGCVILLDYFPRKPGEVLKLVEGEETWFPLFTLISRNLETVDVEIEKMELRFLETGANSDNIIRSWDRTIRLESGTRLTQKYGLIIPKGFRETKEKAIFTLQFSPSSNVCPMTLVREFDVEFVPPGSGEQQILPRTSSPCGKVEEEGGKRLLGIPVTFESTYLRSQKLELDASQVRLVLKGTPKGDLILPLHNAQEAAAWLKDRGSIGSGERYNRPLVLARREEALKISSQFHVENLNGVWDLEFLLPNDLPNCRYQGELRLPSPSNLKLQPSVLPIEIAMGTECGVGPVCGSSSFSWPQLLAALILGGLCGSWLLALFSSAKVRFAAELPIPGSTEMETRDQTRSVRRTATFGDGPQDHFAPSALGCDTTTDPQVATLHVGWTSRLSLRINKEEWFDGWTAGQTIAPRERFRLAPPAPPSTPTRGFQPVLRAGQPDLWYELVQPKFGWKGLLFSWIWGGCLGYGIWWIVAYLLGL